MFTVEGYDCSQSGCVAPYSWPCLPRRREAVYIALPGEIITSNAGNEPTHKHLRESLVISHRCIETFDILYYTRKIRIKRCITHPSLPLPYPITPNSLEPNLSLASLELLKELLGRVLPVALRVVLGPAPQVLARILERALGTPAELGVGAGGVGGEVEDVACAAGRDFVGQVAADGGREGLDHLVDGATLAGAQVPGADAGVVLAQVVEGGEVAVGEVEDVDVIADGSAVLGVVVCWCDVSCARI